MQVLVAQRAAIGLKRQSSGQGPPVDRDDVMRWVAAYERAWRDEDAGAVADLFNEDAAYRASPYEPSAVGQDAIRAFWLDDAGRTFTMDARVVAVDGLVAVVRLDVRYETPRVQEYRDLWVLRFAPDGRVADFEEWAYWPGKPYAAPDDPP
jgi:ketosteroid isomerase-like protein